MEVRASLEGTVATRYSPYMTRKPHAHGNNNDPRVLDALRRVWGYEALRPLQAEAIAAGQGVPAFVVMHDRTLLDLARVRLTDPLLLECIHGMGERKRDTYGGRILEHIRTRGREHHLPTDVSASIPRRGRRRNRRA